jgi:HPr kinase/phosphorylase
MKIFAKTLRDDADFDLKLELLAGAEGLAREIEHPRIQKPGLALAGFVQTIRPSRLQVLGRTELDYLSSLEPSAQARAAGLLFGANIACAIVTTGLTPPPAFIEAAEASGTPLFRSHLSSGTFISRVHEFLEEHLSPEVGIHGTLVDVFGVGVMLTGPSGIGKSECALDLVLRGHRLVGDDVVLVRQKKNQLVGVTSPITRHHMEVRGLGIINVRDLFGAASVREKKFVELVVEMHEWQPDAEYDRTGIEEQEERILEVAIGRIRLPIRPGRNVASIVEVAARNHLLKMQGHNAAKRFQESLERRLAPSSETPENE